VLAQTTCSRDAHNNAKRWTVTIGYRYQPSHRHFVGDVENVARDRLNTEIYNLYHLADIGVERQITDRWSVFASLPFLFAHRNQLYAPSAKYVVNGIGDFSFGARSWLFKPPTENGDNISLGIAIKAPTGKADVSQAAILGGNTIIATADQSIQAGDGGWGLALDTQGFKRIPKIDTEFYMAGVYLFNPMGTNGVPTFRNSARSHGRESVMSIADQYLFRAGFGHAVPKVRGLAASFGTRFEGVPAHDVFGPSNGFRRPGYALSLDPGLLYTTHDYTFTINGPWAVRRDRTRSVPDIQNGIHGDAAFADYTVIMSLGKRF
jgi:hypothetical protein